MCQYTGPLHTLLPIATSVNFWSSREGGWGRGWGGWGGYSPVTYEPLHTLLPIATNVNCGSSKSLLICTGMNLFQRRLSSSTVCVSERCSKQLIHNGMSKMFFKQSINYQYHSGIIIIVPFSLRIWCAFHSRESPRRSNIVSPRRWIAFSYILNFS